MIVAETERLELCEFSQNDTDGFFNLNKDAEVIKYTGDSAFKNRKEVTSFITNYDHYEKYGYGRWSVYLKSTKEYIGFCGLKYNSEKGEIDIGFRFLKKFWNKGYATESSIAALAIGFDKYHAQRIVGRAMKNNSASHSVLKKLGMSPSFSFVENGNEWLQYELSRTKFTLTSLDLKQI